MVRNHTEGDVGRKLLWQGGELNAGFGKGGAICLAGQLFQLIKDGAKNIGLVVGDAGIRKICEALGALND